MNHKRTHQGDLIITEVNSVYDNLTEVTGGLSIKAEGASLPALTEVTGWLYIEAKGASLPALKQCSR